MKLKTTFERTRPFVAMLLVTAALSTSLQAAPPEQEGAKLGPLGAQLKISEVQLNTRVAASGHNDAPATMFEAERLRLVLLAPEPDGESKVAWHDANDVIHITPLDKNDQRKGKDIRLYGRLCDMVAHNDSVAALLLRGGVMRLVLAGEDGKVTLDQPLCFNRSTQLHMGSLAWNGKRYAAYFGIHQGGHEGDTLRLVDPKGNVSSVWDWGCSHCIDMRVVFFNDRPLSVGLSDAYPTTGLCLNHNARILTNIPGDASGGTSGRIAGMVRVGNDAVVGYSRRSGSGWRIVLCRVGATAPFEVKARRFLTGPGDYRNLKIGRLGEKELLVAWQAPGKRRPTFQRFDLNGSSLGKPEKLDVWTSPRSDFRNFANGDIGWAYLVPTKDSAKLHVARFQN